MSRDMQDAVNNFALGFSMMDKVMARYDAAQTAKEKWKAMLQWRMADAAEKAKRNASYDALTRKHGALYDAQIDWYKRRGAGGSGRVSIGSTGKPAYSPADQKYIDQQVAAGYAPPAAQEPSQPNISIDLPEQPPQMPSMPAPPSDSSSDSGSALFNEQHGGIVPRPPMGVGGTSGPGSGFGVRATPPSYQFGGDVGYVPPTSPTASEVTRQNLIAKVKAILALRPNISLAQAIAVAGGQGQGISVPLKTAAPATLTPAAVPTSPRISGSPMGEEEYTTGSTVPAAPTVNDMAGAASVRSADEDIHPASRYPSRAASGGRGAIDTGAWKKLGDQTRTAAYDPTKDWMDPRNIGVVDQSGSGRVNPRVYAATGSGYKDYTTSGPGTSTTPSTGSGSGMFDWAGRWARSIFGSGQREPWDEKPDSGPTYPIGGGSQFSGTGETYRSGGPVRRFYYGGDTSQPYDPTYDVSTGDEIEAYSRKATGMIPSGYAGFASDAVALGRDIGDPSAQDTEHKQDIFGKYDVDPSEQVGSDIGRPVGRAIGAIWGMPQAGADAGEDVVGPVVEMFSNFGKGVEHLGRNIVSRGVSKLGSVLGQKGISGMFGGAGGVTAGPSAGSGAGGAYTFGDLDTSSLGGMGGMGDMGGSGMGFRRGGRVKGKRKGAINTRYRAGGRVPDTSEPPDEEDEASIVRAPYRPSRGDRPIAQRGPYNPVPGERTQRERERDWTSTDTYEEVEPQWMQEREPEGYRRGGRVRRYQDGGSLRSEDSSSRDDGSVLRPQMVPGFVGVPIGRGRASLGATYDPASRYGAVEGGYEHPVGRNTTLGVQGHFGKDLGPEGASARPDWGVGVRGRIRFEKGGRVPRYDAGGVPDPYAIPRPPYRSPPYAGTPEGPEQLPPYQDRDPAVEAGQNDAELQRYLQYPGRPQRLPPPEPYTGNWPPERGRSGAAADVGEGQPDPRIQTRYDYENALYDVKTPEEAQIIWKDYKTKMRHLDPSIQFEDDPQGAGSVRSADEDIHPPSGAQPRGRSGAAGATEPDVPPQGRPAPRRGAVDTSRWKGLRDQTRTEAFDPTKDRADPYNVNIVDDTGRVNPQQGPPAPGRITPRGVTQAGEGPMGGYGLNPQGANARGAGLSTNNAANDMSPIMQAASDYAGHQFHLMANDEHSEGGYHALMAGHGAAPINMIEQGFKKIDPQNQMPPSKKIELLAEHTYDYWVSQGQPEKAAKVAFEIGQFGNTMAKKHAAQAGDLIQQGDFDGAITHLVGGYNWLVDGHEASYDPRSRTITMRDSKTNQVTGQIPATPELIKHLSLGMVSGELNWDIMRGRGGAQQAQAQPPQGPPSRPPVQPAAAPAGPTFTTPPVVTPPQGSDDSSSGSPAGQGETQIAEAPPAGVQTTPPQQLTPRGNVQVWDPKTKSYTNTPNQRPAQTQTQQPAKTPSQGDQTAAVEGSDEWYQKNPYKVPNRIIPRASWADNVGPQPDTPAVRNQIERNRKAEVDRAMSDAAHGNLSQSGKGLPAQFVAQINKKYDKALADLETRQKEWNAEVRHQQDTENRAIADRKVQSESGENLLEGKFEKYLANNRAAYDKLNDQMTPEEKVKQIQAGNLPDKQSRVDAETFAKVHRSPLRYMDTPDKRDQLKEIATQIWMTNPGMSERAAIEHAINFTSFVPEKGKGLNQNSGEKGTNFRILGADPGRRVVLENEVGHQVHVREETMREIRNMQAANNQEFKEYSKDAARKAREDAIRNKHSLWSRTGKELRKIPPVDISTGVLRGYGELMRLLPGQE